MSDEPRADRPAGEHPGEHYCRNCGVRLRRVFGRWFHTARVGIVPCEHAEPEDPAAR